MLVKNFFSEKVLRKVPEITILFWVIKLLTTALGESTSDYMVHQFSPVVAVLMGFIAFAIAMIIQLLAKKYVPWIYWLAVTMVAVFGTMTADVMHIALGVPYIISAGCFALALIVIFTAWFNVEKTLSIHSITTSRRELFYWLAVITTFAMGTAVGDLTAITFKLGFLTSGLLFAALFLIPLIFQKFFRFNEVFAFWIAYIFTRPFGASFADWFGRTTDAGGIGLGTGKTSIILTILIIFFVIYPSRAR